MPITLHDKPLYTLACDTCDYVADEDDEGTQLFDSPADARTWGQAAGWRTLPDSPVLCPACAEEAGHAEDHAQEIAAAVQYALTQPTA